MTFVLGWPEWLESHSTSSPASNTPESTISINLISNDDETLILSNTATSASIWSSGPIRQLLATCEYPDHMSHKHGFLSRGAVWRKDSTRFAVLTTDGSIAIFMVTGNSLSHLVENGLHSTSADNVNIEISFGGIVVPPENGRASSIAKYHDIILVGTLGGTLVTFSWKGAIIRDKNIGIPLLVPLILHMQAGEPVLTPSTRNLGIVDLSVSINEVSGLTIVAFVCADGRAGLAVEEKSGVHLKSGPEISDGLRGFVLPSSREAVRVTSTTEGRASVAIGLARGEVLIYRSTSVAWDVDSQASAEDDDDDKNKLPFTLTSRLSLEEWGVSAEETGAVNCISFSGDGNSLAVGWKRRGAAIFSSAGTRCMCTIPQAVSGSNDIYQWLKYGTQNVAWGGLGVSLFMSTGGKDGNDQVDLLTRRKSELSIASPASTRSRARARAKQAHTPSESARSGSGISLSDLDALEFDMDYDDGDDEEEAEEDEEESVEDSKSDSHSISSLSNGASADPPSPSIQIPSNRNVRGFTDGDEVIRIRSASQSNDAGIASASTDVPQSEAGIIMFPCFKSHIGTELDSALLLKGEDRAIVVRFRGTALDACPEHILYPSKYVLRNWPVTHVAGCLYPIPQQQRADSHSPSEKHYGSAACDRELRLAIAGKHGLAVYYGEVGKWRQFGTNDQENEVSCCCLAWYQDTFVIIGTQNSLTDSSYSLRLYHPTKQVMIAAKCMNEIHLGSEKPICMTTDKHHVAVLTGGSIVVVYKLNVVRSVIGTGTGAATVASPRGKSAFMNDGSDIQGINCHGPIMSVSLDGTVPHTISIRLLPDHLLQRFPTRNPKNESSSSSLTTTSTTTDDRDRDRASMKRLPRLLLHRSDGSLSVLAGRRGRTEVVENGVDAMWTCVGSCECCDAVWIQRKGIVKVVDGDVDSNTDTSPQLATTNEVHPLGFENGIGMIVGVTQVVTAPSTHTATATATSSQTQSASGGRFLLLVRTQPFLHTFFVHNLNLSTRSVSMNENIRNSSDGQMRLQMASSVADQWQVGPHRSHFMELALRGALEIAVSTTQPSPSSTSSTLPNMSILESAVEILKDHDRFPAAVAGCARKVDVKYWETLFRAAGSPISLFDRALGTGDLLASVALIPVLRRSMLEREVEIGREGDRSADLERRNHRRAVAWGLRGTLLLAALLASGDMSSADDLLRFLLGPSAVEIAAGSGYNSSVLTRRSVLLNDVVPDEELRYGVDCVIGNRAELLLREGSVAELVVLVSSLKRWFSLSSWLARNWKRLRVGFEISKGLVTLQNAFSLYASQRSREDSINSPLVAQIPLEVEGASASASEANQNQSQEQEPRVGVVRDETADGDGDGKYEVCEDEDPAVLQRVTSEVEYLFDIFMRAQVWEWALCTATFLRRVDDTVALLKKIAISKQRQKKQKQHSQHTEPDADTSLETVWREFVKALMRAGGSYQAFSKQVEGKLKGALAPDDFEALV